MSLRWWLAFDRVTPNNSAVRTDKILTSMVANPKENSISPLRFKFIEACLVSRRITKWLVMDTLPNRNKFLLERLALQPLVGCAPINANLKS